MIKLLPLFGLLLALFNIGFGQTPVVKATNLTFRDTSPGVGIDPSISPFTTNDRITFTGSGINFDIAEQAGTTVNLDDILFLKLRVYHNSYSDCSLTVAYFGANNSHKTVSIPVYTDSGYTDVSYEITNENSLRGISITVWYPNDLDVEILESKIIDPAPACLPCLQQTVDQIKAQLQPSQNPVIKARQLYFVDYSLKSGFDPTVNPFTNGDRITFKGYGPTNVNLIPSEITEVNAAVGDIFYLNVRIYRNSGDSRFTVAHFGAGNSTKAFLLPQVTGTSHHDILVEFKNEGTAARGIYPSFVIWPFADLDFQILSSGFYTPSPLCGDIVD